MDRAELRAVQEPLKESYRARPESAVVTMRAGGDLDGRQIACSVQTGQALVAAGLHPAAGGTGELACSGDMLLQALAACAGVTLRAVATALSLDIGGTVTAEGDLDFRGTLGIRVDDGVPPAPVGFRAVRLRFELRGAADEQQLATLLKLTERYCVVYQTIAGGAPVTVSHTFAD